MFVLGVAGVSLLLSIDLLSVLARFLIEHDADLGTIARLLASKAPWFLHLSLPVAATFAVLVAGGRMARDSELKAAQAGGIGPRALIAPLVAWGVLVSAAAVVVNGTLEPRAERTYQRIIEGFLYGRPPLASERDVSYLVGDVIFHAARMRALPDDSTRASLDGVLVRRPDGTLWTAREGTWDAEAGVKIAGAGFPVLRGDGVRLVRALERWFLDRLSDAGFDEVRVPLLANETSATATGQLPDKEGQMYRVEEGLYLIPTSEVAVTNLHRDEILDEDVLPLRYCALTPCFRREAGSYGKDVRGLNRVHQFDKVEMVVFTDPDQGYAMLESMTELAEALLDDLGLTYRRLLMCTADMGFTQAKKYDLEVWSPGQERWLEVSSVSTLSDFQARRLQTRSRPGGASGSGRTRLVHTLNGSALALPRTLAAVIETYQQEDGSVRVPEVLRAYLGREHLS